MNRTASALVPKAAGFIIVSLLLSLQPAFAQTTSADSRELETLFNADQAARSEESRKRGIYPTLQEERDRRFAVFEFLAEGKLNTANDYFRAGMIIHHTSAVVLHSGETVSLGTESKLLAFFLFKRARTLGHEFGQRMMAAAYNYYLNACGEDAELFGYRFEGDRPVWRPNASGDETDVLKCGFDPRPHFE